MLSSWVYSCFLPSPNTHTHTKRISSMGSKQVMKPHALCIPYPFTGHITPLLHLAKILHSEGFLITFVNTKFNHQRLLNSVGSDALLGVPSFRFETIPDGLPPQANSNDNHYALSQVDDQYVLETCVDSVKSLLTKVNASDAPVTCIVSDLQIGSTLTIADEMGIPGILFYALGASSLIHFDQHHNLIQKGLFPLKDSSYLVNGYMDTIVDCIPTMHDIRLKDITTFGRLINPMDEHVIDIACKEIERAKKAYGVIFNTFPELESERLDSLSSILHACYGIGPLNLLEKNFDDSTLSSIKSNMWKEEPECLKWLDSKVPSSVIYVNFGTSAMMTPQQLVEFCWGLAKSGCPFLLIIRSDLIIVLPPEFLAETSNRGLLASWCPQEEVLSHPSIGGFFTHSGWNSTIESISIGVPMICWPSFADQPANCWSCCNTWGVAMEINHDVKSDEVAKLVIELMNGEKGKKLTKNAIEWKNKAEQACAPPFGSSVVNLEKLIQFLRAS